MNKNNAIGVFDSGIGGLTVLNELVVALPNESFTYLIDAKNNPYGTRSREEIADLTLQAGEILLKLGVKMIIIACNTATVNSSKLREYMRINYPDVKLIGVTDSAAKLACKVTKNKNVLILATNATIDSNRYNEVINSIDSDIKCFLLKASELVPIVENMQTNTEYSYSFVRKLIEPYKEHSIDTVVLGCTHFGFLLNEIKSIYSDASFVDCGQAIIETVRKEIDGIECDNHEQVVKIYTTGDCKSVNNQIKSLVAYSYQGVYKI
jgi:glutamate racemase